MELQYEKARVSPIDSLRQNIPRELIERLITFTDSYLDLISYTRDLVFALLSPAFFSKLVSKPIVSMRT